MALTSTIRSTLLGCALGLGLTAVTSGAQAATPFVTLHDDGTIQAEGLASNASVNAVGAKLLALYAGAGQPLPEIMSVWSTFPMGGNVVGTLFDPYELDVTGIGLEAFYPNGLTSSAPPLRSILLHNSVLALPQRAAIQHAPAAGFANYLFLLELSHNWGPALRVPAPSPNALVGFPFHWSFFDDAGGSPAGGNVWHDNGDGTFSASAQDPATMQFSMLDLYVLGLASAAEVPDFGVLENVQVPASPTDPLWGGAYAPHSFPWFDTQASFTVTATRRTVTMADVVAANGTRSPAAGVKTSWTLGVVLLVSQNDSASAVADAEALFTPIASAFPSVFQNATHGRGTLEVVTVATGGSGGAGGAGGAGAGAAPAAPPAEGSSVESGCALARDRAGNTTGTGMGWAWFAAALVAAARRRLNRDRSDRAAEAPSRTCACCR